MNFVEFTTSGCKQAWITEPGIDLYVRAPKEKNGEYHILKKSATLNNDDALIKFLSNHDKTYLLDVTELLTT